MTRKGKRQGAWHVQTLTLQNGHFTLNYLSGSENREVMLLSLK